MAKAKLDHLFSNIALLRQYPRQDATVTILALCLVLDAGAGHEALELPRCAISKRPL